MAFDSFGAAQERARAMNKNFKEMGVWFEARRSHTSEIYVAKIRNGKEELRYYQ